MAIQTGGTALPDDPKEAIVMLFQRLLELEASLAILDDLIGRRPAPHITLFRKGDIAKGRVMQVVQQGGRVDISGNLTFDGTNWNFDDTTKDGKLIVLNPSNVGIFLAAASSNPATLITKLRCAFPAVFLHGAVIQVGVPTSASDSDLANGDLRMHLASDTSLRIRVKGSDGTVREVALTLA